MSELETECKGCGVLQEFGECNIQIERPKEYSKCPCRICLLKGICETTCEDYKKFWPNYQEYK